MKSRLNRVAFLAGAVIAANVLFAPRAAAAQGPGYCEGAPICLIEGVCASQATADAVCAAMCGAGVQWAMCFHSGTCGPTNDYEAVACYT